MKLNKKQFEAYVKKVTKKLLREQKEKDYSKQAKYLGELAAMLGRPKGAESVMWRLVDFAGELSKDFPNAIGVKQPTGKGFQIKSGNHSTTKVTRLK